MKKKLKKTPLLITLFVMVFIGFSTVIYGRFTRQFNPEVSSFSVTIASQENIMVSTTGESGTFKDILKLEELVNNTDVSLTPIKGKVTSLDGSDYKSLDFKDTNGNPANTRTYLEFDLYFIASSDMNLYFKGSTSGLGAQFEADNVDNSFDDADRERLLTNLRIGFSEYNTIYQPSGTGVTVTYTEPVGVNVYATTDASSDNYQTFSKLGYSNTAEDTIIAKVNKNEVKKVKVSIWIEQDNLGEIAAIAKLTLSIRFEAILANSN